MRGARSRARAALAWSGLPELGWLHMGWRHLLFASWPVAPETVDDALPDPFAVDTHDGAAWLSVVPYTNVDVRPVWAPEGWGVALPELNLRTYVTHEGDPAVYFFSLDADGRSGVLGARLLHHLPYYDAAIDIAATVDGIEFESRRRHPGASPAHVTASYGPSGDRFAAEPGSLAHFLTERYRYVLVGRDDCVRSATVHHEPWPLYPATATLSAADLFAAVDLPEPAGEPVCHYSPGVDVTASPSRRH